MSKKEVTLQITFNEHAPETKCACGDPDCQNTKGAVAMEVALFVDGEQFQLEDLRPADPRDFIRNGMTMAIVAEVLARLTKGKFLKKCAKGAVDMMGMARASTSLSSALKKVGVETQTADVETFDTEPTTDEVGHC